MKKKSVGIIRGNIPAKSQVFVDFLCPAKWSVRKNTSSMRVRF